jgi:hypothetical protein
MGFGDAERWVHKWVLNEENSRPIIKKALELGINFFDTANVYSLGKSEEILGRALKDFAKRDEVVIATKVRSKVKVLARDQGLAPLGWLYASKVRAKNVIAQILPEPQASLLTGILLGDDAGVPKGLQGAFRITGTSHILAISGLDVRPNRM